MYGERLRDRVSSVASVAYDLDSCPEETSAFAGDRPLYPARGAVKRWAEAGVAGALLLLLSLPLLLISLAIRLESPGPAVFRQVRLGSNFRPFTFYKYRTMYQDAETRFPEMYNYEKLSDSGEDFLFKQRFDPRVTRVGAILRRTGLDELPNFINVLIGDCAFVGPRPEIPEMLPHYTERQRIRFSVPQGLVCLAQIKGGNRLSFAQTADFDVEYARRRSIRLDMKILFLVVVAVARGDLH